MPRTAVCLILSILFGVGPYGNTSVMGKPKIKILLADMSYELQQEALQVAVMASILYENEMDIAEYIAKEFEKRHWGSWNCIMGNSASYLHHKPNFYFRFSIGDEKIIFFKSA